MEQGNIFVNKRLGLFVEVKEITYNSDNEMMYIVTSGMCTFQNDATITTKRLAHKANDFLDEFVRIRIYSGLGSLFED